MRLHGLSVLLHAHSFAIGVAYGGIAFLLAATTSAVSRRRLPDIAGLTFAAAAWLAVRGAWGATLARSSVLYAFALLALGGALAGFITARNSVTKRHMLLVTAVAIAPGAIMLAAVTPLASSDTARLVAAVATIGIGVGLRDFDAGNGVRGAPWLLFAISAAGVYLAVPDTELARVLLGVALPFILLSVPIPMCSLGAAGSAAMSGVFVWVVIVGGRGRPGSVVGGLAAIGLLVAEPIGRRLIGPERLRRSSRPLTPFEFYERNQDSWLAAAFVAGLAQFGLALYVSRVVGRYDAALAAIAVLLPAAGAAIVGATQIFPLERERPRPREHRHRTHHRSAAKERLAGFDQ